MTLTLDDLSGYLRTASVPLPGGRAVAVRELSHADDLAVERAHPAPDPPLRKDPDAGSLAPKIPDTADPAFRREHYAWYRGLLVRRLAVAMDYRPRGMDAWDRDADDQGRRAWLDAAAAELVAGLGTATLDALHKAYAGFDEDHTMAEAGEGNSGDGSNPAAPADA